MVDGQMLSEQCRCIGQHKDGLEQNLLQGSGQHAHRKPGVLPRNSLVCSLHLEQHVLGRYSAPSVAEAMHEFLATILCKTRLANNSCEKGRVAAGLKLKFASASREAFESSERKDDQEVLLRRSMHTT